MKFFLFLVAGIILTETVLAADTLSFENCKNLKLSCPNDNKYSLSQQKEMVLSMLTRTYPDFGLVEKWNSELKVETHPKDVRTYGQDTITYSWVKSTTAMPSIIHDDKYFVDEQAKVRTDYSYSLSKPQDFDGGYSNCGGEGNKDQYDNCRTIYSSNADKSNLEIYQDGVLRHKFTNLNPPNFKIAQLRNISTGNVESVLKIVNSIKFTSYNWQLTSECCRKSCVKTKSGVRCTCKAYRYKCVKSGTGERVDTLTLRDNINLIRSNANPYPIKRLLIDDFGDLSSGYLELYKNGLQSYSIDFGGAKIKNEFFRYNLTYKHEPYNILEMKAYKKITSGYESAFITDIREFDDFYRITFQIPHTVLKKCTISFKNFFGSNKTKCAYSFMNKTSLTLKTGKRYYADNDRIRVDISLVSNNKPIDGAVNVTYGDQREFVNVMSGRGNVTFVANKNYGVIRGFYETNLERGSAENSADVVVTGKIPVVFFTYMIIVLGILYIIYRQLAGKWLEHL